MATVTYSTSLAAPMQAWYKPNASFNRQQSYVNSVSYTAGDVVVFNGLRVPHGAVLTDIWFRGSCPDGTYVFEIGMYGSNATADQFGSITVSATAVTSSVRTVSLPYTVSVSDDAALRYQTLMIRVDGQPTSGTTSVSVNLTIKGYTR